MTFFTLSGVLTFAAKISCFLSPHVSTGKSGPVRITFDGAVVLSRFTAAEKLPPASTGALTFGTPFTLIAAVSALPAEGAGETLPETVRLVAVTWPLGAGAVRLTVYGSFSTSMFTVEDAVYSFPSAGFVLRAVRMYFVGSVGVTVRLPSAGSSTVVPLISAL